MLTTIFFGKDRKDRKELKRKGVIIADAGRATKSIVNIIKDFMESVGWKIEDFPELLESLDITLPVVLHNYISSDERVKFYETNGREGDLRLVCAFKDEAENYEVKPMIALHSQHGWKCRTETYEINPNLSDSERESVKTTIESLKKMRFVKKYESLIKKAAENGQRMVVLNYNLLDVEKSALTELGYTIEEDLLSSYIKW